jgi:hypothetical protein
MKFDKIFVSLYGFYIAVLLISDYILCLRVTQAPTEKPINLKVIPSRMNKLTMDDLDQIKMEVLHDMNSQLKDLEDEMAEKQNLKEKTSSSWSITVSHIISQFFAEFQKKFLFLFINFSFSIFIKFPYFFSD